MGGHHPHETHRAATPLELLFDLTFATSFGLAASQVASVLADGHFIAGLVGFGFASFAICWAWINFSWFSSAYDTDDWVFRIVTRVQMIGVLVLAAGLSPWTGKLRSLCNDGFCRLMNYSVTGSSMGGISFGRMLQRRTPPISLNGSKKSTARSNGGST